MKNGHRFVRIITVAVSRFALHFTYSSFLLIARNHGSLNKFVEFLQKSSLPQLSNWLAAIPRQLKPAPPASRTLAKSQVRTKPSNNDGNEESNSLFRSTDPIVDLHLPAIPFCRGSFDRSRLRRLHLNKKRKADKWRAAFRKPISRRMIALLLHCWFGGGVKLWPRSDRP